MSDLDERISEIARACLRMGVSVIPIGGDKKPAIKWMDAIEKPLESWDYPGCNVAIVTGEINNIIIVDCDSLESWMEWEAVMPPTPLRVKTKRGMHYYYRHPGEYVKSGAHLILDGKQHTHDIKGDRSYALFIGSVNKGHQYGIWPTARNPQGVWMTTSSLPVFDMAWRPNMVKEETLRSQDILNVKAYINSVFAVEGQGGDKTTYKICCCLKESGVGEAEAMALIAEWNQTNCTPPWSISDLYRKLRVVYG